MAIQPSSSCPMLAIDIRRRSPRRTMACSERGASMNLVWKVILQIQWLWERNRIPQDCLQRTCRFPSRNFWTEEVHLLHLSKNAFPVSENSTKTISQLFWRFQSNMYSAEVGQKVVLEICSCYNITGASFLDRTNATRCRRWHHLCFDGKIVDGFCCSRYVGIEVVAVENTWTVPQVGNQTI